MTSLRSGLSIGAVSAAVIALVVGGATPAFAADPTIDSDGVVTIGDAHWQFDEYGLAYGWDAADVYNSDGYIFYPGEFYAGNYAFCGTDGPPTDGTVTVESNGDMTIVCPDGPFAATGLTVSVAFRLFAEANGGYLVRQLVTISNPTDAAIDASNLVAFYYDNYTGSQGTVGFLTSSGGNTVSANDTAFISTDVTGASVVETEAWALSGSSPDSGIVADDDPSVVYTNDSNFAAGETKYFMTFTHMVIPSAQTGEAAEAAFLVALAQTEEFASFSGRLVAGLPEGLDVVGWGTTPTAAPAPALAATGTDLSSLAGVGFGALLLAAAGMVLVRRRRVTA